MSKLQLNTSCRATFKDGHTEEFVSIEEASDVTGMNIQNVLIELENPEQKVKMQNMR